MNAARKPYLLAGACLLSIVFTTGSLYRSRDHETKRDYRYRVQIGHAYRAPSALLRSADHYLSQALELAARAGELNNSGLMLTNGTLTTGEDGNLTYSQEPTTALRLVEKSGQETMFSFTRLQGTLSNQAARFLTNQHHVQVTINRSNHVQLKLRSRRRRTLPYYTYWHDSFKRSRWLRNIFWLEHQVKGYILYKSKRLSCDIAARGMVGERHSTIGIGRELIRTLRYSGKLQRDDLALTLRRTVHDLWRVFGTQRRNRQTYTTLRIRDSFSFRFFNYRFHNTLIRKGYGGENQPHYLPWKVRGSLRRDGAPYGTLQLRNGHQIWLQLPEEDLRLE